MAHYNTVFSQRLKLIPRHEFETLANQHHSGRSFRSASRWSQFVTMAFREYWPEFHAELASQDKYLPAFVTQEFEAYLKCGSLVKVHIRHTNPKPPCL